MIRKDKECTWKELCDFVFNKVKHALKPTEQKQFKKWFMKRESVGYCFDSIMVLRCFRIWQDLQKDLDHFVILSGREGFGKSTFSFQIAAWVNPNFDLSTVAYNAKDYLDIMSRKQAEIINLKEKMETESLVMDEGTELLSRESLNLSNRILTKTFFVQRALKFLILVNVPNFFMVDVVLRLHRVRTLIDVVGRGKYKCVTGKGIKLVAEFGQKTKNISSVKLPNGSFWHGTFNKAFPRGIDYNDYEKNKIEAIGHLLERLKDDAVQMKMIAAAKVAREIGCSNETVIRMIKKEEVEGKLIGSKYYITRKAYDKLITP